MKTKKLKKQIKSLNYQLGEQVGHQIVTRYLVSLSTETIKGPNVIEVPKDEADEYQKLYDAHFKLWQDKGRPNNDAECTESFYVSRKFHHELERKYLPEKIQAVVLSVNPTNMKVFLQAIEDTLWDCDISNYSLCSTEPFQRFKHGWCSYINLVRDEKKIPEKLAD